MKLDRQDFVERVTDTVIRELSAEGALVDDGFTRCVPCSLSGHCIRKRHDVVDAILGNGAARISSSLGLNGQREGLGSYIDHTLLKPEATRHEVAQLCLEAKENIFASVCINPFYVPLAKQLLAGTPVAVCTVVGFPLGSTPAQVKAYETERAIREGATEIDMVINVGALKSGDVDVVETDIRAVVDKAAGHALVKVILETCLLNDDEKVEACMAARAAGADYVKTSTGFNKSGATIEDVMLMRRIVGGEMGVKASGGIRDEETVRKMIDAGASRIGASASVAIVRGASNGKK